MKDKKAPSAKGKMHNYCIEIAHTNGDRCDVIDIVEASTVVGAYAQALSIAKALDKTSETECGFAVKSVYRNE